MTEDDYAALHDIALARRIERTISGFEAEAVREVLDHGVDPLPSWLPSVVFVTRAQAYELLGIDKHRRVFNYELEGDLAELLQLPDATEVVVSEWCPKGWAVSRWMDHCPREDLDEVLRAHVEAGSPDRVIAFISSFIDKRFG